MSLNVPEELTVGEDCEVTVTGSSHANQTIEVKITNDSGGLVLLQIQLDAGGNGSAMWNVEDWDIVKVNYSSCTQVTRYPTSVPAA